MSEIAHKAKCNKLKIALAGDEYKTLIDVMLDSVSRAIQKLFRLPQAVPLWYSAVTVCLLILTIGVVVSALLGELNDIPQKVVIIEVLGTLLAFISLVIFKFYLDHVRAKLRTDILDSIIHDDNIADLQHWLGLFCNVKLHFLFCVIYGLTLGIYTVNVLSSLYQGFIGYGPTVMTCLVAFIWGIPMYFLFVFLVLPIRLSAFEYQLYKPDPRSSEIIAHLSALFGGSVYLYGIVAMGSTLYLAYAGLLSSTLVVSIIVAWLPITLLFFISQYALRKIITRGKWVALREIQDWIAQIQVQEDLAEKETMEKINRLMDYHDRVMRSRNSALNIRSSLDFLNSLLLPVIGYILGNLNEFWMMLKNIVK